MAEQKEEDIKVVDRRMFNADGSLRDDIVLLEETAPEPLLTEATEPPTATQAGESVPKPAADEMEEDISDLNEFMEFLMQISSSAFIYLGMMEHPATGTRQVNLPAARQSIDMLLLLRAKTRGNLTGEEERFFEGLLGDLQMQFVALTNRMGGMQ